VEHPRCAQCRNPIRGRQSFIRLASAQLSFHSDCWVELHTRAQDKYMSAYAEVGVPALLEPYHRGGLASWLPGLDEECAGEEPLVQLVEPAAEPHVVPVREADWVDVQPVRSGPIALGPVPVMAEPAAEPLEAVADEQVLDEPEVRSESFVEEPVDEEPVAALEEPLEEPLEETPVDDHLVAGRTPEVTDVTVVRTRPLKSPRGDRARLLAGKARAIRQAGSQNTPAAS
jgi:hypothetical protein